MSTSGVHKTCAFCGGDLAAYGGRLGSPHSPVSPPFPCTWFSSPQISQDVQLRLLSVAPEGQGPAGGVRADQAGHQQAGSQCAAAGRVMKRRNRLTAEQIGQYVDRAKSAYHALASELAAAESSDDDDAVIAAKDAKRLKRAVQHLVPTWLAPAPPTAGPPSAAPVSPGDCLATVGTSGPQQLVQGLLEQQSRLQLPAAGFNSLGGLSEVKRQLKEMVLLPLAYPGLMKQLGIQPPRGILLHGAPGTGKTAIVRALAAECAALTTQQQQQQQHPGKADANGSSNSNRPQPVALFARKGTDCLGKYAGDAEQHLRLLFDMAAAAAPAIIFLDELDGLVPPRSVRSSSSDQIFASIVSVLLALMDGLTDRGQVLVIGATNRPDSIDPALRRPGRFDREVYFGLPSQLDRQHILQVQTASWRPPPSSDLLQQLAAASDGWAGEWAPSKTAVV
eukprot:gene5258-5493_t